MHPLIHQPVYFRLVVNTKIQSMELMAINRNVYPCREIEIAERLTGKKESGRFKEIPNTTKLRIIEMTRI